MESSKSYLISGLVALMLTLAAIVITILAVSAALVFVGLVVQEIFKIGVNTWSGAVTVKEAFDIVRYGGF